MNFSSELSQGAKDFLLAGTPLQGEFLKGLEGVFPKSFIAIYDTKKNTQKNTQKKIEQSLFDKQPDAVEKKPESLENQPMVVENQPLAVGKQPEAVLKEVFGYDEFRLLQKDIIDNVLSGHDTIAVMPTGGGKSICYQIPALLFEGLTIVISPLIALMQDQVSALKSAGVEAVFLNSTLTTEQYSASLSKIFRGKAKIVYMSPEGLNTKSKLSLFSERNLTVSCITIDEAHCVSEWGHDFRPDYLEIANIRRLFPKAVCLALTATATKQVRVDIAKNLGMNNPVELISSFNRENIYLEVKRKRDYFFQICEFLSEHKDESGIIYCMSRKNVDDLTERLKEAGFDAVNYHAGLTDSIRAKHQELFIRDKKQIMVATVAFGMGINKPNVRFVIHCDLPKSIEQYYQEIGRAGRDSLPSHALLLYSASDTQKIKYFFTEMDESERQKAENLLSQMVHYAESRTCRRKQILQYFGERYEAEKKCDGSCCDICDAGEAILEDVTIPALKFLSCVIRTKQRYGAAYVTDVLLGSKMKRILDNEHDKLSTYGIGKGIARDAWLELASVLVDEGYLIKSGEYGVLVITKKAHDAIVNKDKIMLPLFMEEKKVDTSAILDTNPLSHLKRSRVKKAPVAQSFDASDEEAAKIAVELRSWRTKTAEENNIPPYIIFGDKTINDIAAKKPRTHSALLDVFGMGEAKADKYGTAVLRIVVENLS